MAPKKRTSMKTAPAPKGRKKSGATKKTARIAAKAHTAAVSHDHRYHTYTDHRSESYKHYASIMKTVILFLGFVLLLAIIANIFAPSINNRPITPGGAQNFIGTNNSGYNSATISGAYKQYKYVTPEGTESSSPVSAPEPSASSSAPSQ
ncbi:hypothetical protein [Candidatus Tokpelaia sp.]|uniref:hypothetical protein n=1 Tax=Candidatus Tokpelaia sp. TaxID=2233777 RepID=UPI00123C2BF3|nr:hypothetical protein [Candidatus Tokpelaia sp.]